MSRYDSFIKVPKICLILGGFWPFEPNNNTLYKMYTVYSKFQTIAYMTFIISLLINLSILIVKHDQPLRIFSSINVLIIVLETCVKLVLFQIKKISNMCAYISTTEKSISQSTDEEVRRCYKKQLTYCTRINIALFISTLLSCVMFTVAGCLQLVRSTNWEVEFQDKPFMHDMWYPFQRQYHMPWVILLNALVILQGACFNTATQTTFITLMIYASARLEILQIKLRKFGNVEVLNELIREHQLLIRFVQTLNERTNYVMLLEFVLNSMSLSSGTVQFVAVSTPSQYLSICCIVLMVLIQIFVLAYSANEISLNGLAISDALAQSNWSDQPIPIQKNLAFMMLRAQKPIGINAGPFFRMTTQTAISICKLAYSYMSIMMRNYD